MPRSPLTKPDSESSLRAGSHHGVQALDLFDAPCEELEGHGLPGPERARFGRHDVLLLLRSLRYHMRPHAGIELLGEQQFPLAGPVVVCGGQEPLRSKVA